LRLLLRVPGPSFLQELQITLCCAAHLLVGLGDVERPLGVVEPLGAELRHADQQLYRSALLGLRLRERLLERVDCQREALALEIQLTEEQVHLAVGSELARLGERFESLVVLAGGDVAVRHQAIGICIDLDLAGRDARLDHARALVGLLAQEEQPRELAQLLVLDQKTGFVRELQRRERIRLARQVLLHRGEPLDAIVVDTLLRDESGFAVCRTIREAPETKDVPILMLSRSSSEMDRILALEAGADDVLARPFFARELALRVRSVLRRSGPAPGSAREAAPLEYDPLKLDEMRRSVTAVGKPVDLTATEFAVLVLLMSKPGRAFTREAILADLWSGDGARTLRVLDTHVKGIRRKLGGSAWILKAYMVSGTGWRACRRTIPSFPGSFDEARDPTRMSPKCNMILLPSR